MKPINFKIKTDLHTKLKVYVASNKTTITKILTQYITDLVNPKPTITETKKSEKPKTKKVSEPQEEPEVYLEEGDPPDQESSFKDYLKAGKHKE